MSRFLSGKLKKHMKLAKIAFLLTNWSFLWTLTDLVIPWHVHIGVHIGAHRGVCRGAHRGHIGVCVGVHVGACRGVHRDVIPGNWHGCSSWTQLCSLPKFNPSRLICTISLHVQDGTLNAVSTCLWHRADLQIYPTQKKTWISKYITITMEEGLCGCEQCISMNEPSYVILTLLDIWNISNNNNKYKETNICF